MNIIEKVYIEHTDNLMQKSDHTVFLITGIRFGDYKDNTDAFIQEAAQKRLEVILMPDDANPFDPEAVVCYWGNKKIGVVASYDLEKFHILTRKNDNGHLTGRFFHGDTKDHFLKLSVTGTITSDDINDYRKEVDKQKEELYGTWEHGAIKYNLVSNRHENDAKACISQMKDFIIKLCDGYSSSTMEELSRLMNNYKESSRYDLSLEGQRDRWDIMFHLDHLCDAHHKPNAVEAKDSEGILADVSSQIGGEMGRIVSYESYIEQLTKLVTKQLPSSDPARLRLKALTPQAISNIRLQVKNFPHDLYHLFCNDPKMFVTILYYARIPRRYLDPFLSGIALVQAFDRREYDSLTNTGGIASTIKEKILPEIKPLEAIVKEEYRLTYPQLWNQIFENADIIQSLKETNPNRFVGGYNQKLVCNIIGIMSDKGYFTKSKKKIDDIIYTDKTVYKYLSELSVSEENTSCALNKKTYEIIKSILDNPS